MRIRFSKRALEDLDEIYSYIAQDSETYAGRTVAKLVAIAEGLLEFPHSGRLVQDADIPNTRERIHSNYRIAYIVDGEVIVIMTIHHSARQAR